jgi:hypothetical protein
MPTLLSAWAAVKRERRSPANDSEKRSEKQRPSHCDGHRMSHDEQANEHSENTADQVKGQAAQPPHSKRVDHLHDDAYHQQSAQNQNSAQGSRRHDRDEECNDAENDHHDSEEQQPPPSRAEVRAFKKQFIFGVAREADHMSRCTRMGLRRPTLMKGVLRAHFPSLWKKAMITTTIVRRDM